MQGFDRDKVRIHRCHQAELGFPLLRGCPNTAAIELIGLLDELSAADRMVFAEQLSDFAEVQDANPAMPLDERSRLLKRLPLVERHFGKHFGIPASVPRRPDVRLIPVKMLAGILRDERSGGFEGWAKLVSLSDDQTVRAPAATHAASLDEIVPASPARLRKLIGSAMKQRFGAQSQPISSEHTQFTATLPGGGFKVDVRFARSGMSRQQFDYNYSAKVEARPPVWMSSYEGVWKIIPQWDYVTETNAERSVAHFIRLIETCGDLA